MALNRRLGDSKRVQLHYIYDRPTSRGGALQWSGPHWIDMMPWVLDDPIDRGKDTHLSIYGTDATAQTPVHHDSLQHEPTVPLELGADHPNWSGTATRTIEYEFTYDRFPAWGDYVQDYFEAYFGGYETGDVPATVDDAVQLLRVLDAAYESAERDGWASVDG